MEGNAENGPPVDLPEQQNDIMGQTMNRPTLNSSRRERLRRLQLAIETSDHSGTHDDPQAARDAELYETGNRVNLAIEEQFVYHALPHNLREYDPDDDYGGLLFRRPSISAATAGAIAAAIGSSSSSSAAATSTISSLNSAPAAIGAAPPAAIDDPIASTNSDASSLQTPSPGKKRKRRSTSKVQQLTPKLKTSSGDGGDDEEDDSVTCPICFDAWEMSGDHRLVALRCGHLFGEACIQRWLAECGSSAQKCCPQCKSKASNKDIRHLYAKRLRAIDRTEEHQLRKELDEERNHKNMLSVELATLKMNHGVLKTRVNALEMECERLRKTVRFDGSNLFENDPFGPPTYKLYMEKNISICRDAGCRVMTYADKQSFMLVSQRSSYGMFLSGFGLRMLDLPTFRMSSFIHTSVKMVRDICLDKPQTSVAVVSMESSARLYDIKSKQYLSFFTPSDKVLWSCALDTYDRENTLYLGAQHGSIYAYDTRFPERMLAEFKTTGDLSPVISTTPVPRSEKLPNGGFLVCKLQSLWFFEYALPGMDVRPMRLDVEGPFISMKYEPSTENLLISTRASTRNPNARYIFGTLEKYQDVVVFSEKASFAGSKNTPVMTRCSQVVIGNTTLVGGYMQDTKYLTLYDVKRETQLQSMSIHELVYDTCAVRLPDATYLAGLSENRCRFFRLMPSSERAASTVVSSMSFGV